MNTRGIVFPPNLPSIGWRVKAVEVWVQRPGGEMLLGRMQTNRAENEFCGTLDVSLGVLPTSVTADSEDACVLRMVERWRELDAEENRKEMVLRKEFAAGGEL